VAFSDLQLERSNPFFSSHLDPTMQEGPSKETLDTFATVSRALEAREREDMDRLILSPGISFRVDCSFSFKVLFRGSWVCLPSPPPMPSKSLGTLP
jgi:hypothetical protein